MAEPSALGIATTSDALGIARSTAYRRMRPVVSVAATEKVAPPRALVASEKDLVLEILNNRPFHKLEGSRRQPFEVIERPALKPLPPERYEFAETREARVNIDYYIMIQRHSGHITQASKTVWVCSCSLLASTNSGRYSHSTLIKATRQIVYDNRPSLSALTE